MIKCGLFGIFETDVCYVTSWRWIYFSGCIVFCWWILFLIYFIWYIVFLRMDIVCADGYFQQIHSGWTLSLCVKFLQWKYTCIFVDDIFHWMNGCFYVDGMLSFCCWIYICECIVVVRVDLFLWMENISCGWIGFFI